MCFEGGGGWSDSEDGEEGRADAADGGGLPLAAALQQCVVAAVERQYREARR